MKAETIFGLIIKTSCLDELEPKRFRMKGSLIAQALFRLSINQKGGLVPFLNTLDATHLSV
jgi:hypothetical protein